VFVGVEESLFYDCLLLSKEVLREGVESAKLLLCELEWYDVHGVLLYFGRLVVAFDVGDCYVVVDGGECFFL